MSGLSRTGVAAVRRAMDIVTGLITDDTDADTVAGYHRLARELDQTARGIEDRLWLDERTPHAS